MLLLFNEQGRLHNLTLGYRAIKKLPNKVRIKLTSVMAVLARDTLRNYFKARLNARVRASRSKTI